MTNTRPYFNEWRSIQQACYNPNSPMYQKDHYCSWGPKGYAGFAEYMRRHLGPKPSLTHKLARKDQTLGWEPGNIAWMTPIKHGNQMLNNCVFITYGRRTQSLSEWSRELNISYQTMWQRYHRGWPAKFILSKQRYSYNKRPEL